MTKDLLNGIAITLFIAVSIFLPFIGFIFVLFIPLPIIYYRFKLDRRFGAIIPIFVIGILTIFGGGVSMDIFFLAELLLIGFFIGECAEKKYPIEKTVVLTSIVVLLVFFISMLFYSTIIGTGVVSLITQYIEENLENTLVLYKEMKMPEETIDLIERTKPQISYVMVRILPGMILAFALIVSWANMLMANVIFRTGNIGYAESGRLNRWKAPEFLVWGAIGSGLALLMPGSMFKVIGLNFLLVLLAIYFFQGIAIVSFYFEKKQLPRALRVVLYSFFAIYQILIFFIIGLGFFDVWLDIRKLNPQKPEED